LNLLLQPFLVCSGRPDRTLDPKNAAVDEV